MPFVRYWPLVEIFNCGAQYPHQRKPKCPLMTQSEHRVVLNEPHLERYDCFAWALGAAMRRRQFIGIVTAVTIAWPLAATAQQNHPPLAAGVTVSEHGNDEAIGN